MLSVLLRQEIQRLKTDNTYLEHLARAELGLVRTGEIEFMIVPRGSSPTAQPAAPPPDAAPQAAAPGRDHPTPDAPRGWFDRLMLRAASLLASLRR